MAATHPADAQSIAYTTAMPNPSGAVTCNGQNRDGMTATWTAGGSVTYTKAAGQHTGFYNYTGKPNSNILDANYQTYACCADIITSNNVEAGNCYSIQGGLYLAGYLYGPGSFNNLLNPYNAVSPIPSHHYQAYGTFVEVDDATNVLFTVNSGQPDNGTTGKWVANTPYL